MKELFLGVAAAALLVGGAEATAAELPTYEVAGLPITLHQMSVLGSSFVQERSPAPGLTIGGMPASPHQVLVLTPRPEMNDEATTAALIEAESSQR